MRFLSAHRLLRSDLGRFLDQIKRSSESLGEEGTAVEGLTYIYIYTSMIYEYIDCT